MPLGHNSRKASIAYYNFEGQGWSPVSANNQKIIETYFSTTFVPRLVLRMYLQHEK